MGDFFRVDLPNSFVEPWDAWLQMGIQTVRRELADRWTECFMSAPIWRFTLRAGLAGPSAMMGVLMPSVDRVGREFPLTLATPLNGVTDVPLSHFCATEAFEHMEQVALGALEDGFTRDMLSHRLVQVPSVHQPEIGRSMQNGTMVSIVSQDAVAHLAARALEGKPTAAVWSAVLERDNVMMMTAGLPMQDQMRGLFDLSAPVWNSNVEGAQ